MVKVCLAVALFCLAWTLPAQAFNWDTATARGRDYVTLRSFCTFYNFGYASPSGNSVFDSRNSLHSVRLKLGSPDLWLDGVHYVMSFPIEMGNGDWLVSRMDVIKLFEPIMRPNEISARHAIRGVVIDAGHGGTDNGATSHLGAEKDYTRDTAFRLEQILQAAGLKTVLTRRTDVFVDLYERAHIASLYPDYAFVSLHFNSAAPEARGLETYCLAPRGAASTSSSYLTRSDIQKLTGNDDDALNILLASAVHSEVIKLNPGDPSMDRGVKRARFVVIKANQLPAILVEGGFVSNRMEAARVNSPMYRQALAQAIARGLIKFVNVMGDRHVRLPESSPESPAPRAQMAVIPSVPPAPSGFAREVTPAHHRSDVTANYEPAAGSDHSASPTVNTSMPVANSHKSKKKGRSSRNSNHPASSTAQGVTAKTPAMISPTSSQTVSPTPTEEKGGAGTAASSARGTDLNLAEPTNLAPSPGAEKAPPEPDEPPTVNVYSPGKEGSSGSATPSSSSSTSDSSGGSGTPSSSTNSPGSSERAP